MVVVCNLSVFHEPTRLLQSENLTRKQLSAAILLLVCNDMRFFGFPHIFPTGNEGNCKIVQHSKLIKQCSWPDSVHVLYTVSVEFLAANCRCELQTKLACSVGKQNFWLIAEQGHEHVANRLLLLVLTLAFVFVSRAFSEKSDYSTWKLHPNKRLSYGSIKPLLL